jgi:hypothetical protein
MDAPAGKIVLYTHFFSQSHFRIPVSHFPASLLHHHDIHFPGGAYKSTPEVPMFYVFYKLTKASDWFTFSKTDRLSAHVGYVP